LLHRAELQVGEPHHVLVHDVGRVDLGPSLVDGQGLLVTCLRSSQIAAEIEV
jgi:hypothetical protein